MKDHESAAVAKFIKSQKPMDADMARAARKACDELIRNTPPAPQDDPNFDMQAAGAPPAPTLPGSCAEYARQMGSSVYVIERVVALENLLAQLSVRVKDLTYQRNDLREFLAQREERIKQLENDVAVLKEDMRLTLEMKRYQQKRAEAAERGEGAKNGC